MAIQAGNGKTLGTGYINPHALLCARLVSRDLDHPLSPSLLVHRLNVALSLRERLYDRSFYRLVYSEGDGLPGLIVDRYGDLCVAQLTTAGMERLKDDILAALQKVLKPTAVLWRNDSRMREMEGLERCVADAVGEVPETVTVEEDGLRFQISPRTGQKTGWFYDQRDNRARLDRYVRGRRVLDVFSYVGAWGVRAAARGAREVLCVDSSAPALEQATVLRADDAMLAQWLAPQAGHGLSEHLYVVDPQGQWMMRFPARMDGAGATQARRDLERLLRASASWDQPGRAKEQP